MLTLTRRIAAPPATVWALISDVDGWEQLLSGVDAVERLDAGEDFDVGTRWRETRTMMGRKATEEMGVTAVTPGEGYTVEAEGAGAHYVSRFELRPSEDGSELALSFEAQPRGGAARLLAKLTGPIFRGATRKVLQRDLDDIAAAAEARAGTAAS